MSVAVDYLDKEISEIKFTERPRYGMAADGYTLRSGAPTSTMVRLKDDHHWRRVMVWQFSNAPTVFLRIKGRPFVLKSDHTYAIECARRQS